MNAAKTKPCPICGEPDKRDCACGPLRGYDPSRSTNENLKAAGYATGQTMGLNGRRREIYSLTTSRTVGALTLQEINAWLAFGAPLDERGVVLDLPRTAEGPCMPPGQELVCVGKRGETYFEGFYVEEAA